MPYCSVAIKGFADSSDSLVTCVGEVFQVDENDRTDGGRPDSPDGQGVSDAVDSPAREMLGPPSGVAATPISRWDGRRTCTLTAFAVRRCRSQFTHGGFTRECCTPALWCGDSPL